MKSRPLLLALLLLIASTPALAAEVAASRLHEIADPDTRAWWQATEALSNDAMEGRDIGSPGYDRAAQLVAERFAATGLQPAGEAARGSSRSSSTIGSSPGKGRRWRWAVI